MKIFLTVFVLLCGHCFSQEWKPVAADAFKEVMKQCSAQNNKDYYSLEFKRLVYANSTDLKPVSSSTGKLVRGKGKEYRLESENQLLIQTSDVKMVIDSSEKLVLLMKPDTLFDQISPDRMFTGQDFATSKFFQYKAGNVHQYKIQFAAGVSPYQYMVLFLDAKTHAVLKIEFKLVAGNYMSNDFEDESTEEPRLVVEYKPAVALKANGGYFDLSRWLKRSGDKYELLPGTGYTLDDLRIN